MKSLWSDGKRGGHSCPKSINAVVVNDWRGGWEIAEKGEDIALADAHVPKLATDFWSALFLLPNLRNDKHEAWICAEPEYKNAYLLVFLPPKI